MILILREDTYYPADYEGVSVSSRTSNSKKAASEATSIFQNHYPEFLVGELIPRLDYPVTSPRLPNSLLAYPLS